MKFRQLFNGIWNAYATAAKIAAQQTELYRFIPGTFQRDPKDSGTLVAERIIIQPLSTVANLYRVQKVICYYTSSEEKRIYEAGAEQWTGAYDLASRQLVEVGGKRSFAFLPEESLLLFNQVRYFKVASTPYTHF